MGHNIKLYVQILNTETLLNLFLNVSFFLNNKSMEGVRAFDNIPAPVIVELKAGKMSVPIVDEAGFTQILIPIPPDTEYI